MSASGSCSDTDKSFMSSNRELDNELEFGKDYSNEKNENVLEKEINKDKKKEDKNNILLLGINALSVLILKS